MDLVNPSWNNLFEITVPNHDNSPANPAYLGFGECPAAMGAVRSLQSNFPSSRPQPRYTERSEIMVLGAALSGLFTMGVGHIIFRQIKFAIFASMTAKQTMQYITLFSLLNWLVVPLGISLGVGVYFILKKILSKQLVGPTYICSIIGEHGFGIFTRTPIKDTALLVPFDGVIIESHDQRVTTVLKDQYGNKKGASTDRERISTWRHENGQIVYNYRWSGMMGREPTGEIDFLERVEKAQRTYRAMHKLPLLDGPGLAFFIVSTQNQVLVRRDRIDISWGGQQYSVQPASIRGAGVIQGEAYVSFNDTKIVFDPSQMPDIHLFFAALSSLGVHV